MAAATRRQRTVISLRLRRLARVAHESTRQAGERFRLIGGDDARAPRVVRCGRGCACRVVRTRATCFVGVSQLLIPRSVSSSYSRLALRSALVGHALQLVQSIQLHGAHEYHRLFHAADSAQPIATSLCVRKLPTFSEALIDSILDSLVLAAKT